MVRLIGLGLHCSHPQVHFCGELTKSDKDRNQGKVHNQPQEHDAPLFFSTYWSLDKQKTCHPAASYSRAAITFAPHLSARQLAREGQGMVSASSTRGCLVGSHELGGDQEWWPWGGRIPIGKLGSGSNDRQLASKLEQAIKKPCGCSNAQHT